ncbi:phage tail tape measure protein [Exiguobacterium sp. s155]|uniref:phage tail tape measure protein n=1 Tax=Exiguobacterium sp. s155 TaxID=2751286 RepID=UPI001BE76BE5|nr:phage tail tape measure protein [Exiguobacterium sp. s155]
MAGQGRTEIEIGFEVQGFGEVKKAEDALDDLGDKAKVTGDKVDDLGDKVKPAGDDVEDLGDKAKDTGDKVEGFGSKLGVAFAALGGAAALGAVGTMFWDMGNQYAGAMNQIQASTGTAGTSLAGLEDVANAVYVNNFGESWEDVASSLSTVTQMTGATGDELQYMTESAIGLRDTFGYEVNESIRSVDTMMDNFGITSEEAFNLLAQGQQNGLDKSGEMLDTINEYSGQFGALGFTVDDMFETMNAGLEGGAWNLDKVGDAVKEFNIRAKDGSKSTGAAFKALDMDAEKMAQTFAKGGPAAQDAFQTVVKEISAIEDPIKRNEIGVALFGTQFEDLEVKAFSALGNTGTKFDQTVDSMERINEVKYDTPMEAIAGFGRLLETSIVQPIMSKVMPALSGIVTWASNNMPIVTAAIGGLAVAFGILGAVLLFTVVPAVWAMMAPFLPVIAIALALGAVAGVIIWAWQEFDLSWKKIWTSISTWAVNTWNTLSSYFVTGWTYLVTMGQTLWTSFMTKLNSIWTGIVNFAVGLWTGFTSLLSSLWTGLITLGTSLWQGFKATVSSIFTTLLSTAISIWEAIKTGITSAIQGAYTAVTSTVSNIYTAIVDGFNNAVSFVTGLGQTFYDAGRGLIEQMVGGITSAISLVTDAISGVAEKAREYLPFSPAKVGPLSDLDKLDFGGPITDSIIKASPNVQTSMSSMFTGTTSYERPSIAPMASSSSSSLSNNSSSRNQITININGAANAQETAVKVREQLEDFFASMGRVSPRMTEV